MKRALLLMAIATLAACGGGGSDPPATAAAGDVLSNPLRDGADGEGRQDDDEHVARNDDDDRNDREDRDDAKDGDDRDGGDDRRRAIDDPIKGEVRDGRIQAELQTVAEGNGLTAPNWGTFAPGQPTTLYVVDQDGPLWAIDVDTGAKAMCLNTRELLVPIGAFGPGTYDERGFLGAAFHPAFMTNGLLYTYTSEPCAGCNPFGQPNHRSVIREWRLNAIPTSLTKGPVSEDPASASCQPEMLREVYTFEQPQFNHNGGAIFFGTKADDRNLLYISSGDGGCADDQEGQLGLQGEGPCIGHGPDGNAQNPDTPLGKMLRIDPSRTAPAFAPADVYALGFRNPFRASSDRADLGGDGGVWVGDTGQNHIEEVDGPLVQGGNYGWRIKEGNWLFDPFGFALDGSASDGFVFRFSPGAPAGLLDPVAEYDHDEGIAVVGGFVYRGSGIPALRGHYVFGDYERRVMYVDRNFNPDPKEATPRVRNLVNGKINLFVHGFGEDAAGELYVLGSKSGIPFEETGIVMKIVTKCAKDADCRD